MLMLLRGKAVSWWRRYWAFALPWLLVVSFGPLREVARLHFMGSALLPDVYGQPWAQPAQYGYRGDSEADDLPAGFEHDVRRFWDLENAPDGSHPAPATALALINRYPRVPWLPCVGAWAAMSGAGRNFTPQDFVVSQKMTRQAAALEPDNAFPALCAALWQYKLLANKRHLRRLHHRMVGAEQAAAEDARVLDLWHAAAGEARYSDHMLDVFRCIVASRESQQHLAVEEKLACFWNFQGYDYGPLWALEKWVMQRVRAFHRAGDSAHAIRGSWDVAKLGSLMVHGKGGDDAVRCGLQFLDDSADLFIIAPKIARRGRARRTPSRAIRAFNPQQSAEQYAFQHGQAAAARSLENLWAEAKVLAPWRESDWQLAIGSRVFSTHDANPFSIAMGRDFGMVLVCQGTLVLFFWMATASLFWRRLPVASSRRDRATVALGCALGSAIPGAISCLGLAVYGAPRATPPPGMIATLTVLALLAFFGPVLFSWLACSGLTWRRQQAVFQLDARTQMELALPPRSRFLLSHFLAVGAWASAWLLLASSLGWLLFTLAGTAADNIAAAWPQSTVYDWGFTWEGVSIGGMVYGLWTVACSLVMWILKWRYATSPGSRPATFGALRWWKESLGAYLVLLSWLYLFVGLAYLPARIAANRTFEQLQREGSLGVWRETAP